MIETMVERGRSSMVSNFYETVSGVIVGILLLLTPTFFIQTLMVCLIIFLIWLEYFSKSVKRGKFEYIALPLSGIMSSIMIYYAPIIQTDVGWAIAFITYTLSVSIVLKIVWNKRKGKVTNRKEAKYGRTNRKNK